MPRKPTVGRAKVDRIGVAGAALILPRVFPDLAAALGESMPDGTLLDAEVVIYRGGRLSFDALQHHLWRG